MRFNGHIPHIHQAISFDFIGERKPQQCQDYKQRCDLAKKLCEVAQAERLDLMRRTMKMDSLFQQIKSTVLGMGDVAFRHLQQSCELDIKGATVKVVKVYCSN